MLLSALCEALVAHINSSPETWRPTGDTTTEAKVGMDIMQIMLPDLGVYVIPGVVESVLEASQGRRGVVKATQNLVVTTAVTREFQGYPVDEGIVPWSEAKILLDVRQNVEDRILSYKGLKLVDSTPELINELELDNRNFVALTTWAYEQGICPK